MEPDRYCGGVLFVTERVGAFFYVVPEHEAHVREFPTANGYNPYDAS